MSQQDDILKAIKELAKRENEYRQALIVQANCNYAYEIKRNKGILEAEGSEKIRIAIGELAAKDEYQNKLLADATVKFLKTFMDDCRQVISARQSILSSEIKSGVISSKWSA